VLDNKARQQRINQIIVASQSGHMTVHDIASMGYQWMRKEKIHHHFFVDHSLWLIALHLTLFALHLPYDYKNKNSLGTIITEQDALNIIILFEKRIIKRLPVAYITNEAVYLGNSFYVNEHVLVPRSLMSTRFQDFLNGVCWKNYRVLDLCTGSGCIGITLALLNKNIQVDLVDLSEKALEVALVNIKKYNLENRVRCIQSDLFENVAGPYDLIITNPPYVPEHEYLRQPAEIKNEPEMALNAGIKGLDIIDKIIAQAKNYLNPEGILIAEVGYSAVKPLKKKYPKVPFKWFNFRETALKQSMLAAFIGWVGYPKGIFLCKAKGLPHLL
jgi:ribosomal protein L3 glutamine methyltransferase